MGRQSSTPVRPLTYLMQVAIQSRLARCCAVAFALAGVSLIWLGVPELADARKPRPNVILIVTDDQPLAMMDQRALPTTFAEIVDKGTTFTEAITPTPLCCPSRATLLTGQYGHNNGVLRNKYGDLLTKAETLPVWLSVAGYRTAHVGRNLNGYADTVIRPAAVAPGWDVWQTQLAPREFFEYDISANGKRRHYGQEDDAYFTRVVNRKAARIVKRFAGRRRPFFLQVDHLAPHRGGGRPTTTCEKAALPDPLDLDAFQGEPLPSSPSFNEADVSDKPSFIASLPSVSEAVQERLAEEYRCGLASLLAVDRGVERILRLLDRAGAVSETVFVFTSDHGFFRGEHRLVNRKHYAYEAGLRVPLVIRVPKRYRRGAARVAEIGLPVANIDIVSTILRLARAEPCSRQGKCRTLDGRSLLGLLRDDAPRWPTGRALALEIDLSFSASPTLCSYQGVRVPGAVYIQHELIEDEATQACVPSAEVEHYDLAADPAQLDNLYPAVTGSATEQVQLELAQRVAALRDCAGIRGRDQRSGGRPFCE